MKSWRWYSRFSSFAASVGGAFLMTSCGDSDASPTLDDDPPAECRDGQRNQQRYGTACLCCHQGEFSVAGSVDRAGQPVSRVVVADRAGYTADMVPNSFDNFFRHFPLTPPLFPVVYGPDGRTIRMKNPAPSGDCNACHGAGIAPLIHGPD